MIALALGNVLTAICFKDVVLRTAASGRTPTAAMRSLTSITVSIVTAVPAAQAISLRLILLLLEPTDVFLEGGTAAILRGHCLELLGVGNTGFHLLISVIDRNGRLHALQERPELIESSALLALGLPVVVGAFSPLLLELIFTVSLKVAAKSIRTTIIHLPVQRSNPEYRVQC